jgi:hypothetical protein
VAEYLAIRPDTSLQMEWLLDFEWTRIVPLAHLAPASVSRPFPSWNRSILTEVYLCHACSCQEILRTETAGQAYSKRR